MTDYDEQVREYLDYCRKAARELTLRGSSLNPKGHPTEAGACRLIFHRGDPGEAEKIRRAFRDATGPGQDQRREGATP